MELLGTSKNGIKVFYDPVHSHAATHMEDTPHLKELTIEVLGTLELTGQEVARHFDMYRVVGTCDVVTINETNELVYATRKNRTDDGLVPFVKNKQPDTSSNVAVHLLPKPDGTYILSSAWIGTFGDDEPFPQSPLATEKSAEYWSHYAFVWGSQEVQPGTVQSDRPWQRWYS